MFLVSLSIIILNLIHSLILILCSSFGELVKLNNSSVIFIFLFISFGMYFCLQLILNDERQKKQMKERMKKKE